MSQILTTENWYVLPMPTTGLFNCLIFQRRGWILNRSATEEPMRIAKTVNFTGWIPFLLPNQQRHSTKASKRPHTTDLSTQLLLLIHSFNGHSGFY